MDIYKFALKNIYAILTEDEVKHSTSRLCLFSHYFVMQLHSQYLNALAKLLCKFGELGVSPE